MQLKYVRHIRSSDQHLISKHSKEGEKNVNFTIVACRRNNRCMLQSETKKKGTIGSFAENLARSISRKKLVLVLK